MQEPFRNYNRVEFSGPNNSEKHYTLNDTLHRLNGPAIEKMDGSYQWFLDGRLHCQLPSAQG